MKKSIYFLSLLTLLMFSCSEEEEANPLDDDLLNTLTEASNGEGVSYFILPESHNFNAIPQDPNNPLTPAKIELGKNLFHETAFGTEGEFDNSVGSYSCASCHHAAAGFQAGLPQGLGEGGLGFGIRGEGRFRNTLCDASLCDVQPIRSPSAMNGSFQKLMLWNGQFGATSLNTGTDAQWTAGTPKEVNHLGFEGLETQAIAGLGVHRMGFSEEAVTQHGYKAMFDNVFSDVPKEERYTAVTAGLAIAAYERVLLSNEAPFQKYLRGNTHAMSEDEKKGAILFFGKADCVSCHTGPALNKMEFHALGMNEFNQQEVIHYNPEDPTQLGRAMFTANPADNYKFKVPQLYNLRDVGFLGHGASFHTVEEVVAYKNAGIPENPKVPESQLSEKFKPLGLTETEVQQISAFIRHGLFDDGLSRYLPDVLPSGNCFPNNDVESQIDLGCI